ncbi:MAG: hypothetical protein WDO06_05735 [Actinomycetota bacterium]
MRTRHLVKLCTAVLFVAVLSGCSPKPTIQITQTCEAYLQGLKQTQAGAYPNTTEGNKLFFQQLQTIKDFGDASSLPELKESADAMFQSCDGSGPNCFCRSRAETL